MSPSPSSSPPPESEYIGNPNLLPSPTRHFHREPYPYLSPLKPSLSLAGKTAVITGAGTGVGRATALAFAEAGAEELWLLGGRRKKLLDETRDLVEERFPGTRVWVEGFDVTDEGEVGRAVGKKEGRGEGEERGKWDVLVLNSGYMSFRGRLEGVEVGEWWRAMEVNVKGNLIVLQALLPLRKPGASVLATSSTIINYGQRFSKETSSYSMSKFALTNMMEVLAAEMEDLHVVSFHPGSADTDMYDKYFGEEAAFYKAKLGADSPQLAAHFALWLASPEARFLRGRFVSANWDVPELIERYSGKIQTTDLLTVNVQGWPFSPPRSI